MIRSIIQSSGKDGMQSMDATLEKLVKDGLVDAQAALDKASDKESFARIPAVRAGLDETMLDG